LIVALYLLGSASHSSVSCSTIIHDGIISSSQAKLVGKEYRAFSDDRRRRYIDDARLSITRYDDTNDEEEFEEELDDGNADRSVDSDIGENRQKNKPKRPLNGYFLFACEIRDQVRAANPHLTGSKIVSIIVFAYAVCFVFFVSTVSNATIFHSLDV